MLLRRSVRGSRLGSLLVLAFTLVVLPAASLPSVFHKVATHLLSPPDCALCLSGVSAAATPEPPPAVWPLSPLGLVIVLEPLSPEFLNATIVGGRAPPVRALGFSFV